MDVEADVAVVGHVLNLQGSSEGGRVVQVRVYMSVWLAGAQVYAMGPAMPRLTGCEGLSLSPLYVCAIHNTPLACVADTADK